MTHLRSFSVTSEELIFATTLLPGQWNHPRLDVSRLSAFLGFSGCGSSDQLVDDLIEGAVGGGRLAIDEVCDDTSHGHSCYILEVDWVLANGFALEGCLCQGGPKQVSRLHIP